MGTVLRNNCLTEQFFNRVGNFDLKRTRRVPCDKDRVKYFLHCGLEFLAVFAWNARNLDKEVPASWLGTLVADLEDSVKGHYPDDVVRHINLVVLQLLLLSLVHWSALLLWGFNFLEAIHVRLTANDEERLELSLHRLVNDAIEVVSEFYSVLLKLVEDERARRRGRFHHVKETKVHLLYEVNPSRFSLHSVLVEV